jgi:hypothetical protein
MDALGGKNAQSIIDMGAPLGTTMQVSANGISEAKKQLTARLSS